jgi:hypothetical protein
LALLLYLWVGRVLTLQSDSPHIDHYSVLIMRRALVMTVNAEGCVQAT